MLVSGSIVSYALGSIHLGKTSNTRTKYRNIRICRWEYFQDITVVT